MSLKLLANDIYQTNSVYHGCSHEQSTTQRIYQCLEQWHFIVSQETNALEGDVSWKNAPI